MSDTNAADHHASDGVELEPVTLETRGDAGYEAVAAELQETFEDDVILVYPDDDDADSVDAEMAQPEAHSVAASEHDDVALTQSADAPAARSKLRKQRHTSVSKAAFHIFKGNVGVGIFLLPMVYNDAGYLGSPIVGSAVGLLVVDATLMLVRVKHLINSDKVHSYPDLVRFVFGKPLQKAVNWMIVGTQLGFCLMYVQTASGIFAELFPFTGAYTTFVLLATAVLIPLTFLTNNLSVLAVSSMMATVLVFISVVATFLNAALELKDGGIAPTTTAFGSSAKLPMFLASQLTVLEGVCVVLPVESAIKKEKKPAFQRMLLRTLATIVTMYAVYGSTGYLAFGSSLTQSTVSVMPRGVFSSFVRLALAVNLLLTHPLQFCPAIQICDRSMKVEPANVTKSPKAIATRLLINAVIMGFALVVGPDALDLVLAFIGSLAATFIAVILPALLQLRVMSAVRQREHRTDATPQWGQLSFYEKAKAFLADDGAQEEDAATARQQCDEDQAARPWSLRKVRCVVYILFGAYVLVVGTTTTTYDAIEFFGGKEKGDLKEAEHPTEAPIPTLAPVWTIGPPTAAATADPKDGPFPSDPGSKGRQA